MSKYSTIVSILALLLSFFTGASEKEFWQVAAELEQGMLISENDSLDLIKKLENKIESSKATTSMVSALFDAKLDFYELYGSKENLKSHLEKNLSKISKSHSYYNIYLSKLAILYFEFGEMKKYQDAIYQSRLNNGQLYSAVAELTSAANETNFQLVNSFCHDCNFYLYHNAIANYYSELGLYSLLENFVQNIFSPNYISNNQEDIRSRVFIAYLYVANKCQNSKSHSLNDLYVGSQSGIENMRGLSIKINSILNIGCK